MKIAIISPLMVPVPPLTYGGIERIVTLLAKGLSKHGHQITVFCSGESTIAGNGIQRAETSPYPTRNHLDENRYWEARQLLELVERQREFDLIHFNYEPIILRFLMDKMPVDFLDFFKTPAVCTFHNTTDIPENIEYYRASVLLQRTPLVFISENQRSRLSFLPQGEIIYNGIQFENFPLEEKKRNYLLFLGRITPVKGIMEAIAVAQKTQIPLIIAGKVDPVDQEFYESEVRLHIDGKLVRYVGEVNFEQKIEYLSRARALLFPILWEEPFGLVMIEAMACGTPVLAFHRGSVPEIIEDGVNGYIVQTVGEMADAVSKLKNTSPTACRKSVENKFSAERMINAYEKLFQKITAAQ